MRHGLHSCRYDDRPVMVAARLATKSLNELVAAMAVARGSGSAITDLLSSVPYQL